VVLIVALCGATACAPPPPVDGRLPVAETFDQGLLWALSDPFGSPVGANNWNCRPSVAHPNPVVLAHGTFANMADSWQAISPMLVNAGHCVFALNYGGDSETSFFNGLKSMATSATGQFGPFVNRVLTTTGAKRVDVIGHSQGGVMPRYWMRNGDSVWSDGTPKIDHFVGLAPAGGGTTFYGLVKMAEQFDVDSILAGTCAACGEFLPTSSLLAGLADPVRQAGQQFGGELQPGVSYTALTTKYDNVVTPYRRGFLPPPADNVIVQDICELDHSDHLGMIYDPVVLDLIRNVLDPAHASTPTCRWVPPVFGMSYGES